MKNCKNPRRYAYITAFLILLLTEIIIALFIRDKFIRPYGGDILVTALLCCFVRMFFPKGIKLLPLWVFIFAAAVEISQYFEIITRLGLDKFAFIRIIAGSTFSVPDILCYATGCAAFWLCEYLLLKKKK